MTELATLLRPQAKALLPKVAFCVRVVEGPDAGKSLTLDGSEIGRQLVGQSLSCALRLTDRMVSRRHLALSVHGETLSVADLGSSNGTFVHGIRLEHGYLRGGETVHVGDSALHAEIAGSAHLPALSRTTRFGRLLGSSVAMRLLYPACERMAQYNLPVLLEGETGTGKELLAESLHEQGPRADAPFVVLDSTAISPNLFESELFGHERGAFTGATATRHGVFEQAHGGTLFIDEIGDLPLSLQPKLLRALERGEVRRLGGTQTLRVDVRVVTATRRDLDRAVQTGAFRDDLFHRIVVGRLELPPLRERHGDISFLARHFCSDLGAEPTSLPDKLLGQWEDLPWPGNVRELRNAVMRALSLGNVSEEAGTRPNAEEVGPGEDILARLVHMALPYSQARDRLLSYFERRYVEHALAKSGGNVARAAAASGLARRYFQIIKSRYRRTPSEEG